MPMVVRGLTKVLYFESRPYSHVVMNWTESYSTGSRMNLRVGRGNWWGQGVVDHGGRVLPIYYGPSMTGEVHPFKLCAHSKAAGKDGDPT